MVNIKWLSFLFFSLAAIIHVFFFIYESFIIQKNKNILPEVKIWAFNQGFYNLFLAVAMIIGLYFVLKIDIRIAGIMVSYAGLSMITAGLVLAYSSPKLRKWSILQITPPLIGFVFLSAHVLSNSH
ncbi:MAG: DUF1304 domain-containing protein [Bacteroidetes bacterium]|nr:DUF1304 domain-containing protein [Bacteroidota bacterium]